MVAWYKSKVWHKADHGPRILPPNHLDDVHTHIYTPAMELNFSTADCNCFALRQAARHVTQIHERHLDPCGITPAQFAIIVTLAGAPSLTILALSEAMVMERTTLVRALKPLQRKGLVGDESAEHDSRALVFSLTASGEKKLKEASVAWRAAQDEFEQKFGDKRAKAMRTELFRLTQA